MVQGGTTHDPSWGEEELMKMTSGAKDLSGRVPEQDPGDPEARFRWRRRSGSLMENLTGYLGFLGSEEKYRPKGSPRGDHLNKVAKWRGSPLGAPYGRLVGVDLP